MAAETEAAVESSTTIRIVEIMPRPLAGEAEWVELLNEGDVAVDLSGWRIGDERSSRGLWGALEAGARVVFAAGALSGVDGDVRVLDGRIGNGLNNDGDVVQLIGPDGTVVDLVEYGTGALPAPAAGASLALSPRVWVVNETPTPAGDRVTPALGAVDVVLEASEASPVAGAAGERARDWRGVESVDGGVGGTGGSDCGAAAASLGAGRASERGGAAAA